MRTQPQEIIKRLEADNSRLAKEQVLQTLGYPPVHHTKSLDLDKWIYWTSSLGNLTVEFENEQLVKISGISTTN